MGAIVLTIGGAIIGPIIDLTIKKVILPTSKMLSESADDEHTKEQHEMLEKQLTRFRQKQTRAGVRNLMKDKGLSAFYGYKTTEQLRREAKLRNKER